MPNESDREPMTLQDTAVLLLTLLLLWVLLFCKSVIRMLRCSSWTSSFIPRAICPLTGAPTAGSIGMREGDCGRATAHMEQNIFL